MRLSQLTGAECVEHLRQLGFSIKHRGRRVTVLQRGICRVVVPDVDVVDGPLLDAILRSAGVDLASLLRVRSRSGVYARTRPEEIAPTSKTAKR